MAKARFSGFVKKIDVASDCKMTITIFDPDGVLPELLPMRAARVFIDMETAQPDIEDIQRINAERPPADPDPQQRLNFDETGFQVPSEIPPDTAEPGEAPTTAVTLCPMCEGVKGINCPVCAGKGILPGPAVGDI